MLGKIYKWFWSDLMQKGEPYTRQFSRIAQAHPVFWNGTIGTMIGLCVVGICFLGWLIWHVKDYIKKNPDNKPL